MTLKYFLLASILIIGGSARAQRIFINSSSHMYEMTGGIGSCTYQDLGHFCLPDTNGMYSSACHKDTLYILSSNNDLYRILLSIPGSCLLLDHLPLLQDGFSLTCLTCDKNGLLYGVDPMRDFYRYDPHTGKLDLLGSLPTPPAGDLIFYNDMLLYTSFNQIYSVNIANPSASTVFMNTPGQILWGLIEVPDNCAKNKLYGVNINNLYPQIVELDPVTKNVSAPICEIPYAILDAASTIEDGTNGGLTIDSLFVQAACGSDNSGTVQVFTSSAQDAAATYTLDGASTNTTGLFTTVPVGPHSIHIQVATGCSVDSSFTVGRGLSTVSYQVTSPQDCAHPDGSITIAAASQSLPIFYSLNGNPPQSSPLFDHLNAGQYTLSINDAGHCQKDTLLTLGYLHSFLFPGNILLDPTTCTAQNGSITVSLTPATDPSTISVSLNDGPRQSSLSFPGLDAGTYTLHLYTTNGCQYDSLVSIAKKIDPEPIIRAVTQDQHCFFDNGSIDLSVSGTNGPYFASLNHANYSSNLLFDGLTPATYTISIQDKNTCSWDTSFTIQPYPKVPITISVDSVNPICSKLNSGVVTIQVQGDQAPYWIGFNNTTYPEGTTIDNLTYGDYLFPVINQDGCQVDSTHIHLLLEVRPECDAIYLPNAFTPNGNGSNDWFRVIHSPYLTQIRLRVYDRVGQLLFNSTAQQPAWDGAFHGVAQPSGTYVWTIEYTDLEKQGKAAHGTVLLIR